MERVNFLKPSIREIKKTIRNIDNSYNNPWDILAELCQNAVDAIRIKRKENQEFRGKIEIEINARDKTLLIRDNGCGIESDRLPMLLSPNSTNKDKDPDTIGEKGVGLTFVLFTSNFFKIKTRKRGDKTVKAVIKGARDWKENDNNQDIVAEIEYLEDEEFEGTEVLLKDFDRNEFLELSLDQIEFLLRTHTAIGDTYHFWIKDYPKIDVTLIYIDKQGFCRKRKITNKYWLPIESRDRRKIPFIDYDQFIEFASQAQVTDDDKRRKLKGKIVVRKGFFTHLNNREIHFIAILVPKRSVWERLNREFNLWPSNGDLNDFFEKYSYIGFGAGIFTSVKGMPTGISVEHPRTGAMGYWENIFIIFEDKQMSFDIGRKSIHGSQARIYRKYAKKIFNDFARNILKFYSGDTDIQRNWSRDEVFSKIYELPDLNSNVTSFIKEPVDQEASVAGIFFELVGKSVIKNIKPLVSGYKNKYDLYAKWGNRNIVIEFKYKLKDILKDFTDERKMFDEIDCVVCWEITNSDRKAFSQQGITLEEISNNEISLVDNYEEEFPNATHKLILTGFIKPVYIIELRKFI